MAFTLLVASTTIDAEVLQANFQHVRGGHLLPRDNTTLDSTNGTLSLGASATTWNTLYVDTLDIATSIASADKSVWVKIAETKVSASTSRVSFTGLNGDVDNTYMIKTMIKSTAASANIFYRVHLNGDSATNYGYQYISGSGVAATAARVTNETGFLMGQIITGFTTTVARVTMAELTIYAKTGNERVALTKWMGSGIGTSVRTVNSYGHIWNNTSSTITSIVIEGPATTTSMLPDTNIQIWARR